MTPPWKDENLSKSFYFKKIYFVPENAAQTWSKGNRNLTENVSKLEAGRERGFGVSVDLRSLTLTN